MMSVGPAECQHPLDRTERVHDVWSRTTHRGVSMRISLAQAESISCYGTF